MERERLARVWLAMETIMRTALMLGVVLALAAQPNAGMGQPRRPNPHCLSVRPDRLALTPDQVAKIRDIVANEPESAHRRAEIVAVLTRTQWQVYWRTAGIAAC